jgi:hypothetical protein
MLRDTFKYTSSVYFPILLLQAPTLPFLVLLPTVEYSSAQWFLLNFAYILASIFLWAASIFYSHQNIALGNVNASNSLWVACRKFPQLLLLTILLAFLLFPAFALLIIPGIYLSVRLSCTFYAIILEGHSAIGAINRSMKLTEGHWGSIFIPWLIP